MPTKIIKAMPTRNNDGEWRRSRDDKHISTFEKENGIKTGLPPKLEVKVLLKRNKSKSITQFLKKNRGNKKRLK
jgi:hypothetical protein